MEINNLLFNFIKQNMPKGSFQENSIIEAKIVSLENGLVSLEFQGEVITAKTDLELIDLLGQTMNFIIEEKTDTRMVIKPITQESLQEMAKTMETTINKAIREFGLKKTPLLEEFIGELIHDKLPLNKENLDLGLRLINKLSQLVFKEDIEIEVLKLGQEATTLGQEELARDQASLVETRDLAAPRGQVKEFTSLGQDLPGQDLDPIQTSSHQAREDQGLAWEKDSTSIRSKLLNEIINLKQVEDSGLDLDIKNILVKTSRPYGSVGSGKEPSKLDQALDYIRSHTEEQDLVQLAKFFVKNKVRPSLGNIKFTLELLKEPQVFAEKLRQVTEKIQDNSYINKLTGGDLEELFTSKDKEKLEEKIKTLAKNLELDPQEKKEIVEIKDRLNFIRDLNKEMYFQNINLNYGQNALAGFFNLIKERENDFGAKKPISIFINLNTNNLGNISIACLAFNKDLSLRIGINKEDQLLFKTLEPVLKQRLDKLGYNLLDSRLVYDSDVKVLQEMDRSDSIYFLDVKV